ncbi:hypothetical protein ACFWYW_55725 [Nonomuraea sp. NPDC059023]|uniref:hypothetical protein n=1 Tax=unclassified Nonomuraea TaxID=2593643 RepID=UPI0036C7C8E7
MISRIWRVYTDPSSSPAALVLKGLIPVEMAGFVYRMLAREGWPTLTGSTLVSVVLMCIMLGIVRQRDEARAALTTWQPVECKPSRGRKSSF